MASEVVITQAIDTIAKGSYTFWTIGVTNNPELRRTQHGNPSVWVVWSADSEIDARIVEAHFIGKGMTGATGPPGKADYVYLFAS